MGQQQLRGLVPWVAFAVLNGFADWRVGSAAALALGLALLAVGLRGDHTPAEFVIEISATVFFAAVAVLAFAAPHSPPHGYTSALAMGWLAVTAWGSLAIRRPFTLGIARRGAPPEFWDHPVFRRVNNVITAGWAIAFTLSSVLAAVLEAAAPHAVALIVLVQVAGFVIPAAVTRRYSAAARPTGPIGATS
jgi:hypothetical protein